MARVIVRRPTHAPRIAECHTLRQCCRDGGHGEGVLVLPAAARRDQREQSASCQLTEGQITHRLRSGEWNEIRPGVYALAGVRPTWEQSVLAVTLSGSRAYASHHTAARLYRMRGFVDVPDSIEVAPRWDGCRVSRASEVIARALSTTSISTRARSHCHRGKSTRRRVRPCHIERAGLRRRRRTSEAPLFSRGATALCGAVGTRARAAR